MQSRYFRGKIQVHRHSTGGNADAKKGEIGVRCHSIPDQRTRRGDHPKHNFALQC